MNEKHKKWFKLGRYWLGYGLFAILVGYSIIKAPDELWHLQPIWLLATLFFIGLMLVVELAQFFVFLHHYQRPWRADLLTPLRITTRKSILNATLPAQSGTLLLLRMVTDTYQLAWHDYIRFIVVATILMLFISVLAVAGLVLDTAVFIALLAVVVSISLWARRFSDRSHYGDSFLLLLTGSGVYLCRVLIFWTILRATGTAVRFVDASYFAIITNTLAQFPITPGNIGVREALFGLLSPYLTLPSSVGVLVGAIFQVLRIALYAIIMAASDFIYNRRRSQAQSARPADHAAPD
ncbi:MAG: flippase-like domain-containing protein [Anaerolineales bacterium]|nr:flippase-like domain-containing protein [Anaerolineales bacterium]MCA9972965.1 flippase-like domain-containing protein [Anaerolineales bacterium]